jgi:uncharacterized membrane protein
LALFPSISYPAARLIIGVTYVVGTAGMLWPYSRPLFVWMTPYHLLLVSALFFLQHPGRAWLPVALAVYGLGFGVEVLGVQTHFPFGAYAYGPVLGIQLWGTPLLIGLNWLLLVAAANSLPRLHRLVPPPWRALLAALLLLLLDVCMEPVAIALDMWRWQAPTPPLQNYLAWFVLALLFSLLWQYKAPTRTNPLAPWVLGMQFLFFATLALFLA